VAVTSTRVAVCVITYNRPQGLRRLLEGLDRQTFAGAAPAVEIIVVDNDPGGSACVLLERDNPVRNWPLRCNVETRRGIPQARNAAISYLKSGVDFVAFVDDDEVPEPRWLDELLRVQREYDADAVAGPVLRHFDEPPPAWVLKGGFFEKRRYRTGQTVKYVDTANSLVCGDLFEGQDKPFDERLAFSGGEDTHFFLRAHRAGRRMVWADDAVVRELIPASRANAGWIFRRAYRLGNSLAFCEMDLDPSVSVLAARAAKALAWIIRGILLVFASSILGRHVFVKALQGVYRGVGMLAGLAGITHEEYRKTHGT
jgi:succinoglycan biosynthesis protein ExoM